MERHDQHRHHDHDATKKRHLDPVQQCFESTFLGDLSVHAAAFTDVIGYEEAGLGLGRVLFDQVGVHHDCEIAGIAGVDIEQAVEKIGDLSLLAGRFEHVFEVTECGH